MQYIGHHKKRCLLINISGRPENTYTLNVVCNVKLVTSAGTLYLKIYVSSWYINCPLVLILPTIAYTMGHQNPMLSHSSSHSLPSLHSVVSSAVSSVKSATKVAKSVTKSFKNDIKKGAATAFHPLKKAQLSRTSSFSSLGMPVIVFVE